MGGYRRRVRADRPGVPLTQAGPLGTAALAHARAAVSLRWWKPGTDWHRNPRTGSTAVSRIRGAGYCPSGSWQVAETVYTGQGTSGTPRAAVHWWVHVSKSGHRQIILNPKLTQIGTAAVAGSGAPGATGKAGTYVADFGTCRP